MSATRKTTAPAAGVSNNGRSDEDLVAALVDGDEDALGALYDRYAETLFRASLARLGDRQLAEEVLQDTYLALWNRAELFDRAQGSLIGWLSAIARHRAVDRLRALGRRPAPVALSALVPVTNSDETAADDARDAILASSTPLSGITPSVDPQKELDVAWLRERVEQALSGMPDQERQVIALAYYDELSQSEIAARLDWPLGTVKTRTRRALARLRESLADALA